MNTPTPEQLDRLEKRFGQKPGLNFTKANNYNWYTPPELAEAARRTMGNITLDPASCAEANEIVKALEFLTEDYDGLTYNWLGNVFLNPPYNDMPTWVDKLISEYQTGNIKQAVLISKADTSTQWFRKLWDYDICFLYTRTKFIAGLHNEDKAKNGSSPQFPVAVTYLGYNHHKFEQEFKDLGKVILSSPQHSPQVLLSGRQDNIDITNVIASRKGWNILL